ncbi:hypothetical protein WN55_08459 [Dufourea novaeangliae]|uniref:Uncharacterized protein n=1 Tax=Dufourea novaeangliae TaxID=178035 RepID=A0A154P5B2_DUFNO|nr:hypothetical protein WN55_08459 [Dufourea novaeangliae]
MRQVPVAKSGQPLVSTPLMLIIESPTTQIKERKKERISSYTKYIYIYILYKYYILYFQR